MKLLIEKIILYLQFCIRARHRMGRGVHSPFAFRFIREVVFGKDVGGLEKIEDLRHSLLRNRKMLAVSDLGAGSGKNPGGPEQTGGLDQNPEEMRSIKDLVKNTAITAKKGRLLARIARCMKPERMIELGTGTGISSLYMALACPTLKVQTCEGSSSIADLARENTRKLGATNIEVYNQSFGKWLPEVLEESGNELLIFLDGDHRGERMLEYAGIIIHSGYSKKVLVLDDVHWSADMNRAWRRLVKQDEISLSLELYNTGIAFIHYDIQKDHYILNY